MFMQKNRRQMWLPTAHAATSPQSRPLSCELLAIVACRTLPCRFNSKRERRQGGGTPLEEREVSKTSGRSINMTNNQSCLDTDIQKKKVAVQDKNMKEASARPIA